MFVRRRYYYNSKKFNDEIIIVIKNCSIYFRTNIIIINLLNKTNNIVHEFNKRTLFINSFNEQINKIYRLDK